MTRLLEKAFEKASELPEDEQGHHHRGSRRALKARTGHLWRLVPWGALWRTGANRATHFTTDRTLQLRDLTVPAGTYTLYTIPEPDGGPLIVNRQTGEGGTTYN